jgi:uncharacterized protein (TIRG00374 family)
MRKLIFPIILLLAFLFLVNHFAEAQDVLATFRHGDWRWLILAAGIQGLWLLNVAASFRFIYRLLGMHETMARLLPLAAAANFLNVIAPSMGVGGLAIFIVDGKRRELPSGRVTTAAALYVLLDFSAFLLVLTLGLIVLFERNQLSPAEVTASIILLGIAALIAVLLYLGMRSAVLLGRVLARLGALVNGVLRPVLRRDYLDTSRAHSFAHDIATGLQIARDNPRGWLMPGALALSNKSLLILILFLVFLAFRQPYTPSTLVAGFSVGFLFLIVSPTPSGVGFVEPAMTLALHSLKVPLASAAVIALAFRGITFWLPLAFGMLAFRWASRETSDGTKPALPIKGRPITTRAEEPPAIE